MKLRLCCPNMSWKIGSGTCRIQSSNGMIRSWNDQSGQIMQKISDALNNDVMCLMCGIKRAPEESNFFLSMEEGEVHSRYGIGKLGTTTAY